ncbi:MAG TPA: class I SAM-dependent methyltransferase [Cyclobacteriaceae bacterium]|nr:class I SAM-dependent methyltransferase [Cyclobacteriaceae bacterium]
MTTKINQPFPKTYRQIEDATRSSGFTMASEELTCSLLRTLARSKPSGRFLELGTGTGLSTSWILDGMDEDSRLTSVDHDSRFQGIASSFLGNDHRLQLICKDGGEWIEINKPEKFDYIFADTWHGKFLMMDETLNMLSKGAFYIIDDMLPQSNWPDGHAEKVRHLLEILEMRDDLSVTKQSWATGIVIAVKK